MTKVCNKDIQIHGRLVRLARLDADKYEFLDSPERVIDALRNISVRIDLFSFMQKLPERSPKYNYPMEWDNLAALRVSTFDTWWTQQIDGKTRNMVRKAEKKGITLREVPFDESLVRGIWQIYNESSIRQGKPFPHYGKDIDTVHKEEATFLDRSTFIGAFLGDNLVGFIKLVTDETRTQAGLMNIVSMIQHRDKAPTNALIAEAVRFCAARSIPYLVYSNFSYGKKERDSLSDFKRNNGFQQILLPRYYVPLTWAGSLAFRFGLHRRFADRLPEPIIAKFRELRAVWYTRKLHSVSESF